MRLSLALSLVWCVAIMLLGTDPIISGATMAAMATAAYIRD